MMRQRPESEPWPETLDEAVEQLLKQLGWKMKEYLRDTPEAHVAARFHHGLGTSIRNRYGLWQGNLSLLDSCGSTMMHPDEASAVIIKALWRRLQFLPTLDVELISAN